MATNKRLTLAAAIMGSAVASIDATIVNVALPAIQDDLGGGLSAQQWVSNAYLLALGSLILIGGSLGDIYGERRIFALGVGGFGVFSVVCALAPSIEFLIAARALQGARGALLTPSSLAIIVAAFPAKERGARDRLLDGLGRASRPSSARCGRPDRRRRSWRWIFALNVPLVLATLVLIFARGRRRGAAAGAAAGRLVGALLCALGLGGRSFALIEQPQLRLGQPASSAAARRRRRRARRVPRYERA